MSDATVVMIASLISVVFICLVGWGAWRAFTPRGVAFYFMMWLFGAVVVVCDLHSTWPSSAHRKQADGIITWILDHKEGRSHTYTLGLTCRDGTLLQLRASAMPPFFAKGRDLVSVTYLDEKVADKLPRAIAFHVLSGPRLGYSDVVSADWFGPWLGVLIGPPCGFAALWLAHGNKRRN